MKTASGVTARDASPRALHLTNAVIRSVRTYDNAINEGADFDVVYAALKGINAAEDELLAYIAALERA